MTIGDKIWAYFRNRQVGREASRLEQEALADPFLYEALEGMEAVEAGHEQIVAALQQQIAGRKKQSKHLGLVVWLAAASLALVGGVALWLLSGPEEIQQVAMTYRFPDTLNVVADIEQPVVSEMIVTSPVRMEADESVEQPRGSRQSQPAGKRITQDTLRSTRLLITSSKNPHRLATDSVSMKLRLKKDTVAPVEALPDKNSRKRKTIRGPEVPKKRVSDERRKNHTVDEGKAGWQREFDRYAADSLRYPEDARAEKIEGEVILSVHLNKRHRPARIKLLQKLSRSCAREAIRLVEEYPGSWDTGDRDFIVVIRFKLKDD